MSDKRREEILLSLHNDAPWVPKDIHRPVREREAEIADKCLEYTADWILRLEGEGVKARQAAVSEICDLTLRIAELERENAALRYERSQCLNNHDRIAENERLRVWVDSHDFKYDWRAAPGDVRRAISDWLNSLRDAIKGDDK